MFVLCCSGKTQGMSVVALCGIGVGAIIPFSMKLELPLRGDSLLYPLGSECPICLTPSGSTLPWQGQNLRQTELCGSGARTTPHSPLSPSLTGTPPSFEIHWPHPPDSMCPDLPPPSSPNLLNSVSSSKNMRQIELCDSRTGAIFPSHTQQEQNPAFTRTNPSLFEPDELCWPHPDDLLRPHPNTNMCKHPVGGS